MDTLLSSLVDAETSLHQQRTRRDTSKVSELLHHAFMEIGRSGATYTRGEILNLLATEPPIGRVVSQNFALTHLGPGVALLTYRSAVIDDFERPNKHALRASIWVETEDGWKLQFHQGTPTGAFRISDA